MTHRQAPRLQSILAPLLVTAVVGACTDDPDTVDATSTTTSNSSASAGGGGSGGTGTICSHAAPFESVTDVLGVNTSENNENNARLSHDELTIVFGRKGPTGGTTQYTATH